VLGCDPVMVQCIIYIALHQLFCHTVFIKFEHQPEIKP
jgi:hypothetical protein